MEIPCVRFDDLSPGGSGSFGLLDPEESFVARRLEDVAAVFEQAEAAARRGLWVAGYVSYEAAPAFNPILTVRPVGLRDRMRDLPLAEFQTFRSRVALEEIDSTHFPSGDYNVSGWTADAVPDEYRDGIAAIGRAVMAGEVAQLKHTFRLHAAFSGDPAALYRDLLLSQRGPHAVCFDAGRFRLVSASPQAFFRRDADTLTVRPVLATVRRGRWLSEDLHLAELLRNDRDSYTNRLHIKELESELAEIGDVISPEGSSAHTVERLETVWQLTADVVTRLRPETGLRDIFAALFPLVTVTGVPKVEAMELVAATEQSARGVYCGSIGFLSPTSSGSVDASFNIAVRTVVVDEEEGVAEYGVGAAITNRSEVVTAFEEARVKAKVLVDRRPDFSLIAAMRFEDGALAHESAKLQALQASAEYFGYAVNLPELRLALRNAVATLDAPTVVTLSVDRDGSAGVELEPAPIWSGPDQAPTLAAVVAGHAVSSENVYLFHNTTNRRVFDSLLRDYPDADIVIFCNERDEAAGAIGGNLVVWSDGQWLTPPLECGTVATALRNSLLADGTLVERVITHEQLLRSPSVGVIDDIHGWRMADLAGS